MGELVDLNTLLVAPNGWEITRTSAINEGRQIASLACRADNAFECMPALLSPVPEPAASVLWSGGLLLLASRWVLRRPSRRHDMDRQAAQAVQRYTSTGIALCTSTFCVSLPRRSPLIPLRPCEAIRIRSQPASRAVEMIIS